MSKINTGLVIKKLRQDENLTQDELSVILGVNKSSIQKYESNAVPNLKMETIRKLCECFRVPPWVFVFPEVLGDYNHLPKFKFKTDITENINFALALNEEGLTKVLEYVRDLIDSGNYQIKSQDEVNKIQDK